jgi:DNA transformation protein
MATDQDFLDFVLDQLSALRRVTARRMFGGVGLYCSETFFALIDEGRLYFCTDETTRRRFKARGMGPFEYAPGKVLRSYYEIPVDVLEDDATLCEWAREAIEVQTRRRALTHRRRQGR